MIDLKTHLSSHDLCQIEDKRVSTRCGSFRAQQADTRWRNLGTAKLGDVVYKLIPEKQLP
jgi:hypothetical protein